MTKRHGIKKAAAVGALVLSASMILAGCGGKKDATSTAATSSAAATSEAATSEAATSEAATSEAASEAATSEAGEAADSEAGPSVATEESISASSAAAGNSEETMEGEISVDDSETEDDEDEADYDPEADDESDYVELDGDIIYNEDLFLEDDSEEEDDRSPEEKELDEYIDANISDELLERLDSFRYDQTMYDKDGNATDLSGYIYMDDDTLYIEYKDGSMEYVTDERDDGFDPDINLPVRYVYANDETKEDNLLNYQELFYLWGDESITERTEADGKLTFVTENKDQDFVEYILSDAGIETEDPYTLKRVTVFDKETKLLESSDITAEGEDGTIYKIFSCSYTANPEKGFEPDEELLKKLDSEDTHALKVVIDPGTEEEATIEGTVGKGCAFYPLIYDGYTYYTDPECTLVATEEELYETENDVVLYAAFEEIPEDEVDFEDGEYDFELDENGEIDLSDLFEDSESEEPVG